MINVKERFSHLKLISITVFLRMSSFALRHILAIEIILTGLLIIERFVINSIDQIRFIFCILALWVCFAIFKYLNMPVDKFLVISRLRKSVHMNPFLDYMKFCKHNPNRKGEVLAEGYINELLMIPDIISKDIFLKHVKILKVKTHQDMFNAITKRIPLDRSLYKELEKKKPVYEKMYLCSLKQICNKKFALRFILWPKKRYEITLPIEYLKQQQLIRSKNNRHQVLKTKV